MNEASVVILAAGLSSRMKFPKFLLKYDEKYTFLEHIVSVYKSFGCAEIIIVINKRDNKLIDKCTEIYNSKDVKLVINDFPELERFYSLKLGLRKLVNKRNVFIHNADNPFVNNAILKSLLDNGSDVNFVIPVFYGKGGHPILLHKKVVVDIVKEERDNLNLKYFLKSYSKRAVKVNDRKILVNINTTQDYIDFKEQK